MQPIDRSGMGRRDFLIGATLLAAVTGLPLAACKQLAREAAPSDSQRKLIGAVSQLVIPRTATAGAGEVGTGDFVVLALAHGLEKSRAPLAESAPADQAKYKRADGSLDHLAWLEADLDARASGNWLSAALAAQTASLTALDSAAFAEGVKDHPWRTIKGLILTGYYTSEVGGSKELLFELVPGRFDPDLPVTPQTRAYSSDWTAVDFG